ncbi:MAG TPA: hypothetical protein VHB72_01235 [Candidatus Saccharimonadales bacterium]|nr:hypothetical protein [Candidatus Saccharimonadales bacterium]
MPSPDLSPSTRQPTELLDGVIVDRLAPTLHLQTDAVGADTWRHLIDVTQTDGHEHGVAIGRFKDGTYVISDDFADPVPDDPEFAAGATLSIPASPFGIIKGFIQRVKKETLVHTHPMGPELDHVRTTVVSDKDIHQFMHSDYNASVVLDRGGAHLLARTGSIQFSGVVPPPNLVTAATHEVIEEGGGSMDLLARVAGRLSSFGLGYYYTSDLSPQDGIIAFQNLRTAEMAKN